METCLMTNPELSHHQLRVRQSRRDRLICIASYWFDEKAAPIEAHRGRIEFESTDSPGTLVAVDLPLTLPQCAW